MPGRVKLSEYSEVTGMKKIISLVVLLVGLLAGTSVFAFEQQRAGFIVYDYSGNMEAEDYKDFRTVTRWAYRFPYYVLLEGKDVAAAREVLGQRVIDRKELLQAAEADNLDVVVLVRLYDFLEFVDTSRSGMENGPIVRVEAWGDLIVYRRDSGKVLVDKVSEREFFDLGNHKTPGEIFKWRLSDLVNRMEGRELIR